VILTIDAPIEELVVVVIELDAPNDYGLDTLRDFAELSSHVPA
jgi:hypothetical protein